MAGATEGDFAGWYVYPATKGAGRPVFAPRYRGPFLEGASDYDLYRESGYGPLYLPYYPPAFRQTAKDRAQRLIDWCADPTNNSAPLTAGDSIILIGGAYGWLGDALIELIPGIAVCCVDISDYVQDSKDQSFNDQLKALIATLGSDPDGADTCGRRVFEELRDDTPRASGLVPIVAEAMNNNGSRQRVRAQLPRNPTRAISEESWQVIPDADKAIILDACQQFGVEVIHIINRMISH